MSKVIKNTIIYTIGNSLPMAATLFLLPIYTKYLAPSEYGIVGSMEAMKVFFAILFSFCIERGIVRLYWDYETLADKKKFLGTVFISIVIISILGLILTFVFNHSFEKIFISIPFYPYFLFAILTSFLGTYENVPKLYFRLTEQASKFVTLSFVFFFLTTGLTLWFVIVKNEGAAGYLKGQLYGSIIMTVIYLYISLQIVTINFNIKILRKVLSFTLPFIPPLIISWFINQSNRIFIERYVSIDAVGIYTFSSKISMATSIFTTALMVAFEPIFYRLANTEKDGKQKIYKFFQLFVTTTIVSSFIVAFLSKEVLNLFFSLKYHQAYIYIAIITFAYIFGTGTAITGLFFQQSKKMLSNMYISIAVVLVSLLLNYFLIPKFALYGAAIALFLSAAFAFFFAYYYTRKKCFFVPLDWKSIIPLLSSLIGVFLFMNYFYLPINLVYLLGIKIIFTCFLLIYLFLKFKKELKDLFI
jgi:O-antigen/teichoic acid export membrane protein